MIYKFGTLNISEYLMRFSKKNPYKILFINIFTFQILAPLTGEKLLLKRVKKLSLFIYWILILCLGIITFIIELISFVNRLGNKFCQFGKK